MRPTSFRTALCLALLAISATGNPVLADGPVDVRSSDIALHNGLLTGSVLNTAAKPVSGLHVHLLHRDTVVATAVSDEKGQFVVKGLRNGNHVLQIGTTRKPVRFWGSQSAPPSAIEQMSIVVDEEIVRGQGCGEESVCRTSILSSIASNPAALLIVGGATAAVIVISTDNDDDASP